MIKPIFTPPPIPEMGARLAKVQAEMEKSGLDHFVCADPDNILWLTNFANFVHERPFILVVSRTKGLTFVVPKLEVPHVKVRTVGDIELRTYFEFPAPKGETWADAFTPLFDTTDKVGVENTCPFYVHSALPCDVVASELVERCRYIKSDYELGRIVYASNIATDKIKRILKAAKPGQSVIPINGNANKLTTLQLLLDQPKLNVLATHVGYVVQPPSVSDDPHNFTNLMDLNLERGGPNVAVINGVMNGYGTEVERTFFLGEVPEAARKPYQTMMKARHLAFDLCKPGNSMHAVDAAVNQVFIDAGYGEYLLHRTGHSIGVTAHEGPFLAEGFHEKIKPGMIFTIEPGLYIPGIGGFRHSDTVLVTENGNQNLTSFPDSIEAMTLPISKIPKPDFSGLRIPMMKLYARLKGLHISTEA
jgi:Xaa-Pro dipeptidase